MTEFIKLLLDTYHEEKTEMLTYLYDVLFVELYYTYEKMHKSEAFYFFAQQYIEILIFCLHTHHMRIRYYIIKNEIIQHVLKGLILKKKVVNLMICKFVKSVIQSKDEFLIRYLETKNLLRPLFDLYTNNAHKSELFQSVILEIISIIYSDKHENLQKQIEIYPLMSSSMVKNIIKHSQEPKNKKLMLKDYKRNLDFFNERIASKNDYKETNSVLNLNLLDDEDELDPVSKELEWNFLQSLSEKNENEDKMECENSEIMKTDGNIIEKTKESYDTHSIPMSQKRAHSNKDDEFNQIEKETFINKKLKLE